MPLFNGRDTVTRAIQSVQAQTDPDWELVVVDDGSTDDSHDVVTALARSDERIFATQISKSGGPARPRNVGINRAQGRVVCFLDQDDHWAPDKLAAQRAKFASGDFGLVYSDALVEDVNEPAYLYSSRWGPAAEGHVIAELIDHNFIPALTVASPTHIVRAVGGLDERLAGVDDYDLWLRIALAGHAIGHVDRPLATWTLGDANLSRRGERQGRLLLQCLRQNAVVHPEHQEHWQRRIDAARDELMKLHLRQLRSGGWPPVDRLSSLVHAIGLSRRPSDVTDVARAVASPVRSVLRRLGNW